MKNSAASASQPGLPVEQDVAPPESTALEPSTNVVLMFERLATNKDVDVAKLERLIAMQERILEHNARAAFNAAFSEMQSEIPVITERGEILNKDGKVQSTFAKNEDSQEIVRPILKRFGFSLGFRTEWPTASSVKVVGILTHRAGHSRESEFLSAADSSGNKNAIQALGSAISYGHRYTSKDLLNITTRGEDTNGHGTTKKDAPAAPEGYEAWLAIMDAVAADGTPQLMASWNRSQRPFRDYITRHEPQKWLACKAKAEKVGRR